MTITGLILPICILILLYALIHPIKTFRSIVKVFIYIMACIIILAILGILVGQIFTTIMNLFN